MYHEYFTMAIMLFMLSILGLMLNSTNLIMMLMCIELMLLAASFMFMMNAMALDNPSGQLFVMIVVAMAASESALGLATMVAFYSKKGNINIRSANLLKG